MDLTLIPVFLVIGCVVGFIAGLLGIGGGMTMIPLLTLIFSYEHFPTDDILHIAVATSMATIVFTSIASVRAHNQHRAVLWPVFWKLAPGILIGSLVTTYRVGMADPTHRVRYSRRAVPVLGERENGRGRTN